MANLDTDETLNTDTSQHAAEVQACQSGRDIRDNVGPTWGRTAPQAIGGMQAGRFWEAVRPLEAAAPAPPRIEFPLNWQVRHGRFNRWQAGGHAIGLLQARREY